MNTYILAISFFFNIHDLNGYEYFRTIKPPDDSNSWAYHQRLNRMPTTMLSPSNANLSDDFVEPSNEDPCAIILACSLLTKFDSDTVKSDNKLLRAKFEDDFSLGSNVHLDSSNENYVVNQTVGYITQLCNTANVRSYLKGVSSNYFPETCNPDEYDLTVIFSELIFLADSSIPFHQDDNMSRKTRVQKKSDLNEFVVNDKNHYHLQTQEESEFSRRSDSIRSRLHQRKKKKRKYQERSRQTKIESKTSHSRRKRVRMLEDWGKPNAKFYGRFLWKPPDSEKYSSKCEACEEKRTSCFAYYMGTYGICGVVWYLDFITDADGLIGDYFRPATTICNLATYPRTADCVWNTYQNCYRQDCGLIGVEWAALPSLKFTKTGTLLG